MLIRTASILVFLIFSRVSVFANQKVLAKTVTEEKLREVAVFSVAGEVYFYSDLSELRKRYLQFYCVFEDSLIPKILTGPQGKLPNQFDLLAKDELTRKKIYSHRWSDWILLVKFLRFAQKQNLNVKKELMVSTEQSYKGLGCVGKQGEVKEFEVFRKFLKSEMYMSSRFKKPSLNNPDNVNKISDETRLRSVKLFLDSIDRQVPHEIYLSAPSIK